MVRVDQGLHALLLDRSLRGQLRRRRAVRRAAYVDAVVFFRLSSWELGLLVFVTVGGAAARRGRRSVYATEARDVPRADRCAAGSAAWVVGLILAFGLTLAVGRYQDRRADVVDDANTIGTAYLRAQTIAEPQRSRSLALLRSYNDLAIRLTHEVPGNAAIRATAAEQGRLQQELWRLAGEAMNAYPVASAPRLYLDSLNAMIDQQTVRLSGLNNRVPGAVLSLELFGGALALGLLALYLSVLGRGLVPVFAAASWSASSSSSPSTSTGPARASSRSQRRPSLAERATMSLPPAAPAPR